MVFGFLSKLFFRNSKSNQKKKKKHLKVFAVPIDEVLARETETGKIPRIIQECIDVLENNTSEEGLFRVPGSELQIQEIIQKVDSGKPVNLRAISVNTVGSLLKRYFRDLPEPLLTYEQYPNWLRLTTLKNQTERRNELIRLFKLLPEQHQDLFISLLSLLTKISTEPSVTTSKMTSANLSFIFGMNVMRPSSPSEVMSDFPRINSVMQVCIEEYTAIQMCYDELRLNAVSPLSSNESPMSPSSGCGTDTDTDNTGKRDSIPS